MRRRVELREPRTARGALFAEELSKRIVGDWDEPHAVDDRFTPIFEKVDAMSSPPKLAVLESATMTLRPGEVYVEVGVLFGASTIAATRARDDVRTVAIDNFSQFGGSPERFLTNIRAFGLEDRVSLRIDDYRAALAGPFDPIGAYFFDGPHSYMDQWLGLELAVPHLADEAIVIVDDTRWPHVRRADLDYAAANPALSLLADLPSRKLNDWGWWNGLQVFEYRASEASGRRDLRFQLNRARYGALQPMKLYEIYYPHVMPHVQRGRRLAGKVARRLRGPRGS